MFKKIAHIALAALTIFSAVGPVSLSAPVARAASPDELSYQGRLKDADGIVVADGSYDFTFTLWTALSGGSADWTEDQTLTVTDGYFSAQVGSVDPFLDGAGQETNFTSPLFLEVEVEAETLVPRVAINSVAYAFSSRAIESYTNEAAADAETENFGGRMYYNTTNGNLYVYDAISVAWVDVTAASGTTMDVAYNAFATDPAIVNVDNAQGQGDLRFALDGGADVLMVNSSDVTFVTFSDAGVTTVDGLFDANGALTLGDGGDTAAINSSDWDISATGDLTGIGAITADGAVSLGTTLAVTGNTTLTGDLAVNGDDISSDGDLTLTLTGGQLLLADTNVFNVGGVSGLAYNAISNLGGAADGGGVGGDNDLYVQDDLEVDGTTVFDGNVDLNGATTVNAVLTFNASPVFNSTITTSGAIEANGGITTQNGTALTMNSGDIEAVNIGTDTDAESINIGTGAATKTITIGNGTLATVLNFDSGTGGVDFDLLGAMSLDGELVVVGGAADGTTATGDGDLYVVGDFEVDGTSDFGGLLTLGDGGDTVAIDSSDWDITAAGVVTGLNQLSLAFPAPADATNGIAVTNTASANSYDLIDVTVTSPTGDFAPDTAQGINLTLGAPNENTDAVKGISITGTAAAAGSVFGIELNGGSGASTDEWGIIIDSGWDMNLYLYDTTAVVALIDGGVLTFEDDTGNDMFALADVSTANNHVLSGDANTGLSLSGMTTDISTPTAEDLTIAPGGVGDVVIDTDADTTLTLNGGGDGTNSLVMTDGSLQITDGDLVVGFGGAGGDFDVNLDVADSASITSAASTSANPFSVVLTSTGDATVNAFSVAATASNQTDRTVRGVRVNMTSQGTSVNDITNGIFVDLLATSGATDKAIEIENAQTWDRDLELQNDEWIGNVTNGTVTFNGDGGSNTTFSIDIDSASAVPTLVGGTGDVVAVNDSLSIGVDGVTTHSISGSGFVISGGNDLYVADDAGVNGDLIVDGALTLGSVNTVGVSFATADATPAVTGGNYWVVNNSGAGAPTTITTFDGGINGQIIFVRVADVGPGTDISCAATINCGTTAIALGAGDFLTFFLDDMNNWQLVSMMDDSDNHSTGNGFDLAEWFPSSESLAPGDVVSVDPSANEYVMKSSGAYDRAVVGIVSTNPGMTLGEPVNAFASQVALAGRVPVNVTDENGAIAAGDYLVASSTPGFAMKATEAGPVIGIAMETLSGSSGQVVAKIANFWYAPAANEASALQGSDASALSSGALSADTVAAGSASFSGNVTVVGHLYAGADAAGRARIVSGDTRVHVSFENAYAYQPIVNATLRTATDIPGYWWVEEESTTGFDLVLDGTLTQDVEFNWIALGTDGGRVSVSDGSTREINVYVVGAESAPSPDPEPVVASEPSAEPTEGDAPETPVVEGETPEVAPTEEPVTEPSAEPEAPSSEESAPIVETAPTE